MKGMIRVIPIWLVLVLLSACGEESQVPKEDSSGAGTDPLPMVDSMDTGVQESAVELPSGQWALAVLHAGQWWKVEGCGGNYGLSIDLDRKVLGHVDRVGLMGEVWNLSEWVIREDGQLFFATEQGHHFEGTFRQDDSRFGVPVVELNNAAFKNLYLGELGLEGTPESIILFYQETGSWPAFLHAAMEPGCPDFEEGLDSRESYAGMVQDCLNGAKLSSGDIQAILEANAKGGFPEEGCAMRFEILKGKLILIVDCQDGDDSDVTLYSVDQSGSVRDEQSFSGVFNWLENNRKYVVKDGSTIYMEPGRWQLNEDEGRMDLVTSPVQVSIDEDFNFEMKR